MITERLESGMGAEGDNPLWPKKISMVRSPLPCKSNHDRAPYEVTRQAASASEASNGRTDRVAVAQSSCFGWDPCSVEAPKLWHVSLRSRFYCGMNISGCQGVRAY